MARLSGFNITGPQKYAHKDLKDVLQMQDWKNSALRTQFQNLLVKEGNEILQFCTDGGVGFQNLLLKDDDEILQFHKDGGVGRSILKVRNSLVIQNRDEGNPDYPQLHGNHFYCHVNCILSTYSNLSKSL